MVRKDVEDKEICDFRKCRRRNAGRLGIRTGSIILLKKRYISVKVSCRCSDSSCVVKDSVGAWGHLRKNGRIIPLLL